MTISKEFSGNLGGCFRQLWHILSMPNNFLGTHNGLDILHCTKKIILTNYENIPFEKGIGTIVAERLADTIMLLIIITVALFLEFEFRELFFSFMLVVKAIWVLPLCDCLVTKISSQILVLSEIVLSWLRMIVMANSLVFILNMKILYAHYHRLLLIRSRSLIQAIHKAKGQST